MVKHHVAQIWGYTPFLDISICYQNTWVLPFVVWIELLKGPMWTPRIGRVIPNNPPWWRWNTSTTGHLPGPESFWWMMTQGCCMCCPVYRILNTAYACLGAILLKCRTTSLPCKLNYSPLPGPVPKPVSLELQIVLLLFFSDIEIRDDGIHFGAGSGDRFSYVFLGSFLFFPCATRVI